jgi:hypothetical protein
MEPTNKNANGMLNGLPRSPQESKKIGPIIGVLVIVLVIIIAALYFFGQRLNTTPTVNEVPVKTEPVSQPIPVVNNDAAAINADLDAQLKDIDYSF